MSIFKRPRPIPFRLRWLVILAVVPGWVAAALAIAAFHHRERATLEANTVRLGRSVRQAVDRDLTNAITALQVLALSPELDAGLIDAFRRRARAMLASEPGNGIVLIDVAGHQVMSTIEPHGKALPRTSAHALVRAVLGTRMPAASDLHIDATSGQPQVAVGVPVIRNGRTLYVLMMGLARERLDEILRAESLPPGWAATILDRKGAVVARSPAADELVRPTGAPRFLDRLAGVSEGVVAGEMLGGAAALAGFSRSRLSGWTAVVGMPHAGLIAGVQPSLWLSVAGAGAMLLPISLLAWHVSDRIGRSVRPLSAPDEIHRHEPQQMRWSHLSPAGEMAAAIAHELSQPLTAIAFYGRGCLRLLADPRSDPAMLTEGMREVVQQAERATEVLVRLREFVRYGAARRLVAVNAMIDTAVTLINPQAADAGVEITVRSDPDLPCVFADNVQIEQVLLNLLRNAIEAMADPAYRRRAIVVEARRKGANAVEISVCDTGPGIPDALGDKIFEPFLTTKPSGMGMGLSISRTLVSAQGGALRAVPGRGAGATFVVELPTAPVKGGNDAE